MPVSELHIILANKGNLKSPKITHLELGFEGMQCTMYSVRTRNVSADPLGERYTKMKRTHLEELGKISIHKHSNVPLSQHRIDTL